MFLKVSLKFVEGFGRVLKVLEGFGRLPRFLKVLKVCSKSFYKFYMQCAY